MNGTLARQPSLQTAFEEAVRHHQAGRLAEAGQLYGGILAVDPNDADSLHLLGLVHHHAGRLESAADLINRALRQKPDVPSFHNNLGCVLKDGGKTGESMRCFERALALDPEYAEALNNLGNALKDSGRPDDAVQLYEKALALNPDYAAAHYNLGCALKELKKHKEASERFFRAVSLCPDYAEAHNNLGNMLVETGQLDKAAAPYEKALALRPGDATVRYNLMSLRFMKAPVEEWETVGLGFLGTTTLPVPHEHEILVKRAICLWHKRDLVRLDNTLASCRNLSEAIGPSDDANIRNMRAYQVFLERLLEHSRAAPVPAAPAPPKTIAVIGDSHCLSYANSVLDWKGEKHNVSSRLITGGKAWHLSGFRENKYTWGLRTALDDLPPGTACLFSFGEIDCRPLEGIAAHWKKHGGALEDSVSLTVKNYVGFVSGIASARRLSPAFVNVPAPDVDGLLDIDQRLSQQDALMAIAVVRLFNDSLKREVERKGLRIVDVYSLSAAADGKANKKYHVDHHHLIPEALALATRTAAP